MVSKKYNDLKIGMSDQTSFMNLDFPIQERTVRSFLINFKRLLVEWGLQKSSIQFDDNSQRLRVGGREVVEANVDNLSFQTKWLVPEWASWKELQEDAKFLDLKKVLQDKLDLSKAQNDKGKGKGPPGKSY